LYTAVDESLEQAQVNKLEHHIRESRAAGANRVLEIGCGWGGCLRRMVQHSGVKHAVGLTLSQAQADYVQEHPVPGVEAHVESWQDHRPAQPYDAIISIGAFEHFARIDYSETQKEAAYKNFFKCCQEVLLADGGYLSLQTFAYGSARSRQRALEDSSTQFLAEEIFRETDPPTLANIAEAVRGHFEIVSLRNDRLHYAQTLREWMARLKRARPEALKLVGEETVRRYERYLQYSFIGFQTGNLDLYRITLRRLALPVSRAVVS
jgi:cyclopropane-fatty-acyl-phospholipid synthase